MGELLGGSEKQWWSEYKDAVINWVEKEAVFYTDGMCIDYGKNPCFRPVFVLREVHNANSEDNCKMVNFLESPDIEFAIGPTWVKASRVLATLEHAFEGDCCESFDPYQMNDGDRAAELHKSAIVNMKKVEGGSTQVDTKGTKKWTHHAAEFKDRIKTQILTDIKPNILICGGTFTELKKYVLDEYEIEKVIQCNKVVKSCYVFRNKKVNTNTQTLLVIDMYHPSARFSYEEVAQAFDLVRINGLFDLLLNK